MRTLLLSVAALHLVAATPLPLKAPISRVRLHPSEAWVTRTGQVRLEAGTQTISLSDLPAGLAVQDLQVQARGPEGLRLGDVSVSTDARALTETPEWKGLLTAQEGLRDRRDALETRKEGAQQQIAFLKNLQATHDKDLSARLSTQTPNPATLVAFTRDLDLRLTELLQQERRLGRELEKLGEEEGRLKAEMDRRRSESRTGSSRVQIELALAAPGTVTLEVGYRNTNALWTPHYEARLSPDHQSLELALFAGITQSSGEAWDDVQVEISNARPGRSLDLGAFDGPVRAGWQAPRQVPSLAFLAPGVQGSTSMENSYVLDGLNSRTDFRVLPKAREAAAVVEVVSACIAADVMEEASGLSITYRLEGRKTIPQDGQAHRFLVVSTTTQPTLKLVSLPRLDPTVLQTACFAAPAGLPLFPGCSVVHFVGPQRLGESALKLPDPGQPFQFAFGPFKPLSVAFRKLSNREEQVGAFTRERQWTVKERVEFSNDSAEPLVVEVQDPLVVSAVDRVRVTALPETTPGHVEKSPGVRTWTLTIGPKATQSLALATQVRAPLEGQVSGLEAFGIR